MQEKRKDERVRKDFRILCRIYERTELEGDLSKIIDISKSGLCFLSNTELSAHQILELTLRVPPDFKEKITVYGRVIDSQKETNTEYKTRVAFIDISLASKSALEKFIVQGRMTDPTKKS